MGTARFIASQELERSSATILKQVNDTGEPFYITHEGKTQAVIVDINHYNAMMDLFEEHEAIQTKNEDFGDQTRAVASVRGIIKRSSRMSRTRSRRS